MANHIFQRFELKYLIRKEQRARLESVFSERLIPDEYGVSTICNIYYDTPNFRLIRQSLEKPVYKEKLRLRSYGTVQSQDAVYLELKKKYRGVVYKRRISLPEADAVSYMNRQTPLPTDSQIGREIEYFCTYYAPLQPAVYLCYDREAFFDRNDHDLRITFDMNIRFRQEALSLTEPPGGHALLAEDWYLMEIKTAQAIPLWLTKMLSAEKIYQTSFSKYGRAYEWMLTGTLEENRGILHA